MRQDNYNHPTQLSEKLKDKYSIKKYTQWKKIN